MNSVTVRNILLRAFILGYRQATNDHLGEIVTLSQLSWQPYEAFIREIDPSLPLAREMITPRDLAAAPQLKLVQRELLRNIHRPNKTGPFKE